MGPIDKKELLDDISRPYLRPIFLMQLIFGIGLVSTPFIFIWLDWNLTWKVGLTSVIGIGITRFLFFVFEEACKRVVDAELVRRSKGAKVKSKFQIKLDNMVNEIGKEN